MTGTETRTGTVAAWISAAPRRVSRRISGRRFSARVTYGEALLFGALFLLTLPREETFLATAGGSRTMYGYLLHAPAILGAMALCGVFTRAGEGLGLDAWEWVICGGGGARHYRHGVHDRAGEDGVSMALRTETAGVEGRVVSVPR